MAESQTPLRCAYSESNNGEHRGLVSAAAGTRGAEPTRAAGAAEPGAGGGAGEGDPEGDLLPGRDGAEADQGDQRGGGRGEGTYSKVSFGSLQRWRAGLRG